jgi:hypothetical protein
MVNRFSNKINYCIGKRKPVVRAFYLWRIALLAAVALLYGSLVSGQTQTFTSSGNFTVPAGVTSIVVECWGAGGGGSNRGGAAGAGGGGAYTSGTLTGLVPGSTIVITVGTGGGVGSNGGQSIVSTIIANGGSSVNNSRNGGAGGAASAIGGDVIASFSGGAGGNARANTGGADNEGGGGGGGSATSSANGGAGGNGTATGGTGGTGDGAGGSGADGDGTPDAVIGSEPGGGGGGRGENAASASKAGANGQVIITWAVPYYSQNSGDPAVLSNWNSSPTGGGSAPANFTGNNQAFIVQSGHNMSTAGAWSVSGTNTKVQISSNASITAANQITLSATTAFQIDNGGTYTHNNTTATVWGGTESLNSNSTVNYGYAGAQTVEGITYGNLTLSGSGAKTTTGVTVNGILSMEGTATASATPTYGASATLQYNTATSRTAGAEWNTPFAASGGVIISNTGAITMNAAKTFNLNVPLAINSGASLSTNNLDVTFGGNFINNGGTFTCGSSNVIITNTGTQSIAGFTTTGTVSMTKTGGTATPGGNVSGGALTINGAGGTLNLGTGLTHTFTGTWTRTNGTINGGSSLLRIGGNVSGAAGTFTAGTGTVEWNASGAQTCAVVTYNNLTLSGSGIKTFATTPTVNAVLSMEGTATVTVTAGVVTYGAAATLQYNTTTSRTSSAEEWITPFAATGGVIIANTGTITMDAAKVLDLNVPLAINSGASLSTNNFTITFGGNYINSGGTFTCGSSNVTIANTGTQSIAGFTTTGIVSMTKTGGTATLGGNTGGGPLTINGAGGTLNLGTGLTHTFTGAWTLTTGTLNGGSSFLNVGGSFSTTGGTFTAGTGTVNYNSAAAQNVGAITYNNLSFSGAGTKTTLTGTVTVANNWDISGGTATLSTNNTSATVTGNITGSGAITSGTGTISIAGNFSNSGTFTCGTGTVNYNGTSQQVKGTTYYNLTLSNGGTKSLQAAAQVNRTLTLNTGILELGNYNLYINYDVAAAITGAAFGASNMIATDGTGYLYKNATSAQTLYPIGGGGYYSPVTLSITAGGTTGQVYARAVSTSALGTGYIPKYWDVYTTVGGKTITATYTYSSSEGGIPNAVWFKGGGAWQTPPPTGTVSLGTYAATVTGTTSITTTSTWWTMGIPNTYYSYQSGSWNDPATWTSDPGGTTQVGTTVPGNNDFVVILTGRTVTLPANIATTSHDITINEGGFLDLSAYQFTSSITSLSGQGTLKIASAYFPTVTTNSFVTTGGGTTEYYNAAGFNLPSQSTYNNLTVNAPGIIATQLITTLILNGNLYVKQGTFRINNNSATTKLNLTVSGNVTVDAGASITVGNGSTNTTTTPTGIAGGTAPYLNYYEQFHRVVIYGDFTNNGTVKFTNLSSPVYDLFPPLGSGATSGAASVYFLGTTDNTLTCNGTTDFYNLILDKGSDQTYKLTIQPSAYGNFRLFGANIATATVSVANPDLMKALWIRTGTLVLKGTSIIPSLTEGTAAGADFYIPAKGALVLDGPDAIVMSTADASGEVNVAYGVGAASGVNTAGASYQGMVVYGLLQVNDGYLSTRESAGLLYNNVASGQIIVNGGIIDAKQLREYGTTGSGSAYIQNAGTLILRGRFVRPVATGSISDLTSISGALSARAANGTSGGYGTFNINNSSNVFSMSGGSIRIYDVCTTGSVNAVNIISSAANTSVTGGTFEFMPLTGTGLADAASHLIYSVAASFGNIAINRGAGCTTTVQLNTYPLTVIFDLTLTSGSLLANNLNVTVGGNFTVSTGTTYNSGTNTTTFNGSAGQNFTIDGTINNGAAGLTNLAINKTADTLTLAGSQTSLTVQGTFGLTAGTFDDGGKTVIIAGNITNSGTHTGTGKIQLTSTAIQTIGGDGNGVFSNVELNNTNAATAPVSLTANTTVNGALTFSQNKLFNISTYNLTLGSTASIVNGGTNRYLQSGGNAGDGGLTKVYSSTTAFSFPVGVSNYTPASLGLSTAPSVYGSITVIPVNYAHPNVTTTGRSLTYFWRVRSAGFTLGAATVTHGYTYNQGNVVTGGGITEDEYVAARYSPTTYTWTRGVAADVDETNNIIGEPGTGSFLENVAFIDGEYTAGDDNPTNPFGAPVIFYSRINGALAGSGLWSTAGNWSYTSNTGPANTGTSVPGVNDIVIIGGNDSIYLDRDRTDPWTTDNVDPRSCASLQIESGSAFDMGYNTNCVFSMVLSHPNGNGNFRVTTSSASGTTFTFPAGDFSDFNQNLGTTELYTTNPYAGTTYWLPNNISSYGNLIISPLGGSNVILPNTNLLIYGNLITRGQNSESWFCLTWNSNYPTAPTARAAKTITVRGYFHLQGGALIYYGSNALAQNIIIDGDLRVNALAGIMVYSTATNQSIQIGGDLVNNAAFGTGVNLYAGCNFTLIPLTFFGEDNAFITNTSGTPSTTLQNVTINKGTSQATTLTCDIGGTLNTPTDNWLTLQNGTFRYMRTNPATDFTISKNTPFTIPSTSGLYIDYANAGNTNVLLANCDVTPTDANDVFLNGKLTLIRGNAYVGPANGTTVRNNDIEYSGGGASEIEIQGGTFIVNGQIRRNPAISYGILSYTQTGGAVTINGQNAITTNAKFEILNTGSSFSMSSGTLTIVRGGGGTSFGDLFLRPETSSVTGGTIVFAHNISGTAQTYRLDANISLNNITITGRTAATAANAQVDLMVNPLVLNGTLLLSNSNSILNTNSIDVTIKGDLTNDGSTASYLFGTNLTTFNGNAQNINGTAVTNFYDLTVSPVTSLTLSHDADVGNNLELGYGTMVCGGNAVYLERNFTNNATYTDTQYGVILNGSSGQQQISGTGTFGRLELNNSYGAKINNAITLQKDLVLTTGIFDINRYMLTLGQNSNIGGSGFGAMKMITTDGVFSNVGITKVFGTGATTFTYPIGVTGKYTPAVLTVTASGSVGSIRVNNINSHHPGVFDPSNVLQYFWEMESSGITGFEGNIVLHYLPGDVNGGPESDYVEARLIIPGTSWTKGATGADNVDETNHRITFNFVAGTSNLSGEYTAGNDAAIPDEVPVFTSNSNGNWNNPAIWTQTAGDPYILTGGPNGFIVIVDHEVSANASYCQAYRTTINGELRLVSPYSGHNLGTVDGSGTLYLESGTFPAGRFGSFLDCANNSTIEYGGSGSYTINADLYDNIPNLLFSGTGTRILPDKDLTICSVLNINGPALDNSTYNRKLTIQGSMLLTSGSFNSGSGSDATVIFAGSASQTVSGFSGANSFNNFEIDNSSGLILTGSIAIDGNLLLTSGIINTSSTNSLTLNNSSVSCVSPSGGSSSSYINGPLVKSLNQGDTYFRFPIGNATSLGNKLSLRATQTGTLFWTAEYINPSALNTYSSPLTAINEEEYWNVSTPSGGKAIVNIQWDPASNLTPLMTQNGLSDMRVAEHNGTNWIQLTSTASGDNYNGSAETSSKVTISSGSSKNYTLACINTPKPRIRLAPTGPVCGDAGIPVTLSTSYTIFSPYTISYTIDGAAQTPLTPASFPTTMPTGTSGGVYQLTGFTYNYPSGTPQTGVFDVTSVTTYTLPTTADAGTDQSLCGATGAALAANTPAVGTGLWSIIGGTGGTVVSPTVATSDFNGTNGTTYTLRWTISNGTCTSSDNVTISFPLLPVQPSNFTSSSASVCQGQTGVVYTVPNDPSVAYDWTYTGSGATIIGSSNSVTVNFDATSTSGTLSVTATNGCGTSAPRSIAITVNVIPTITLDANPSVCKGDNSADLSFSATTGSPNQYSIGYSAAAIAQGFVNVANAPLGSSPVILVVPVAAAANVYNADLTVRNSTTGCISSIYSFTLTIHSLPLPTLAGIDTLCQGETAVYTTEAGMSSYTWTVSAGGSVAAGGGAGDNSVTVEWNAVVFPPVPSPQTITVNYTDANGCRAGSDKVFDVDVFKTPETGPAYYIPNEYVP